MILVKISSSTWLEKEYYKSKSPTLATVGDAVVGMPANGEIRETDEAIVDKLSLIKEESSPSLK